MQLPPLEGTACLQNTGSLCLWCCYAEIRFFIVQRGLLLPSGFISHHRKTSKGDEVFLWFFRLCLLEETSSGSLVEGAPQGPCLHEPLHYVLLACLAAFPYLFLLCCLPGRIQVEQELSGAVATQRGVPTARYVQSTEITPFLIGTFMWSDTVVSQCAARQKWGRSSADKCVDLSISFN